MTMDDITRSFPYLNKESRQKLLLIFEGDYPNGRWEIEDYDQEYPNTCSWLKMCWNWPDTVEVQLSMLNELLGGFGVESVQNPNNPAAALVSYVNMGDTYAATILYDHDELEWIVTTIGDWQEGYEQETGEQLP